MDKYICSRETKEDKLIHRDMQVLRIYYLTKYTYFVFTYLSFTYLVGLEDNLKYYRLDWS